MRPIRALALVLSLAALCAPSASAQEGRQFKDAWFWGAKTGGLVFSSASSNHTAAPLLGGEWLITRTRGGLYLSFDQAFFSTSGAFQDRDVDSSFVRPVELRNLRRFTLGGFVFPAQTDRYHPYGGVGMTLSQVAGASFPTGFSSSQRYAIALDSLQAKRTSFSPVFIGGMQMRLAPFSVFGQATASPNQTGFFLYNSNGGAAFNFSFEAGIRYNVGTSIDRAR